MENVSHETLTNWMQYLVTGPTSKNNNDASAQLNE